MPVCQRKDCIADSYPFKSASIRHKGLSLSWHGKGRGVVLGMHIHPFTETKRLQEGVNTKEASGRNAQQH